MSDMFANWLGGQYGFSRKSEEVVENEAERLSHIV